MSAKQFHQQPLLAGTSVAIDHKGQDDHYDKLRLSRMKVLKPYPRPAGEGWNAVCRGRRHRAGMLCSHGGVQM
jgi:hypothetical protein